MSGESCLIAFRIGSTTGRKGSKPVRWYVSLLTRTESYEGMPRSRRLQRNLLGARSRPRRENPFHARSYEGYSDTADSENVSRKAGAGIIGIVPSVAEACLRGAEGGTDCISMRGDNGGSVSSFEAKQEEFRQ